jgi:hypothetical protein
MPDLFDPDAGSMKCPMGKVLAQRPAGWPAIGVGFVHTGMETNYQNRGAVAGGRLSPYAGRSMRARR